MTEEHAIPRLRKRSRVEKGKVVNTPAAADDDTRRSLEAGSLPDGIIEKTSTGVGYDTELIDVLSQSQHSEGELATARAFFTRSKEKTTQQILTEADQLMSMLPNPPKRIGAVPSWKRGRVVENRYLPLKQIRENFYERVKVLAADRIAQGLVDEMVCGVVGDQPRTVSFDEEPAGVQVVSRETIKTGLEDVIDVIHVCEEELDDAQDAERARRTISPVEPEEFLEELRVASDRTADDAQNLVDLLQEHSKELDDAVRMVNDGKEVEEVDYSDPVDTRSLFDKLVDIRDFWKDREDSGDLEQMLRSQTSRTTMSPDDLRIAAKELLAMAQMVCGMLEGSSKRPEVSGHQPLSQGDSVISAVTNESKNTASSASRSGFGSRGESQRNERFRIEVTRARPVSGFPTTRSSASIESSETDFYDAEDTFSFTGLDEGQAMAEGVDMGNTDEGGLQASQLETLLQSLSGDREFEVPEEFSDADEVRRPFGAPLDLPSVPQSPERPALDESLGDPTHDSPRQAFGAPLDEAESPDINVADRVPDREADDKFDFAQTLLGITEPVETRTLSHKSVDILRQAKQQGILEPLESFSDVNSVSQETGEAGGSLAAASREDDIVPVEPNTSRRLDDPRALGKLPDNVGVGRFSLDMNARREMIVSEARSSRGVARARGGILDLSKRLRRGSIQGGSIAAPELERNGLSSGFVVAGGSGDYSARGRFKNLFRRKNERRGAGPGASGLLGGQRSGDFSARNARSSILM